MFNFKQFFTQYTYKESKTSDVTFHVKSYILFFVRKDMDVTEHERLHNYTWTPIKVQEDRLYFCSTYHCHSRVFRSHARINTVFNYNFDKYCSKSITKFALFVDVCKRLFTSGDGVKGNMYLDLIYQSLFMNIKTDVNYPKKA